MLRKLILLSSSLLLAIPASADLITFNLDQGAISTLPGGTFDATCQNLATLDCVIFSGSISFTTDQDYFVNDIQIAMSLANPDGGADVSGNDNYFFVNVPGTFGPDGVTSGSFSGGLFEIDVAPDTPIGVYNGTATLSGHRFDRRSHNRAGDCSNFSSGRYSGAWHGYADVRRTCIAGRHGRRYRRK
jgi:hypothetical protein